MAALKNYQEALKKNIDAWVPISRFWRDWAWRQPGCQALISDCKCTKDKHQSLEKTSSTLRGRRATWARTGTLSLCVQPVCAHCYLAEPAVGNQWESLVFQWLRIPLPMQETWAQSLVQEDPTCPGQLSCEPWLLSPHSAAIEAVCLEPVPLNQRSHRSERPEHRQEE